MKLKKSTIFILVLSWILFFAACFAAFFYLEQRQEAMATNEKIFKDQSTKKIAEKNDYADVKQFMADYYEKIQKDDREALKSMVEDFEELEKQQDAMTKYVEAYRELSYQAEQVEDTKDYIVYVSYELKIKGIDTPAPGMTPYYLKKDKDSFLIYNNEEHDTEDMKEAKEKSLGKENNKELIRKVNQEYEDALKADKKLKEFFEDD